jgi:hypothetical protein
MNQEAECYLNKRCLTDFEVAELDLGVGSRPEINFNS